jgi:peptidoglycan/xylan/chitin deacetylase (PgdA/CDA1 family)
MPRRILLLLYHHAGAAPRGARKPKLWVSPALLALHVRFLRARGWRFATVSAALGEGGDRVACVTFDDGFADVARLAFPALARAGVPATLYAVTGDVGRRVPLGDDVASGEGEMASWDDLRRLRDAGWEIGSHSAEHRRLAALPPAEQRRLVAASRDALTAELGRAPRSFAYPFGSHGTETVEAVRAHGFESALTTRRGLVRAGDDPFRLPRLTMGGDRPWHALRLAKLAAGAAGLLDARRSE